MRHTSGRGAGFCASPASKPLTGLLQAPLMMQTGPSSVKQWGASSVPLLVPSYIRAPRPSTCNTSHPLPQYPQSNEALPLLNRLVLHLTGISAFGISRRGGRSRSRFIGLVSWSQMCLTPRHDAPRVPPRDTLQVLKDDPQLLPQKLKGKLSDRHARANALLESLAAEAEAQQPELTKAEEERPAPEGGPASAR